MLNYPSNIYRQAIVVLGGHTTPPNPQSPIPDRTRIALTPETTSSENPAIVTETRVFQMTLSSVPVIWESELGRDYQELGQALSELTELQEDEGNWQIERSVYNAACNVAAALKVIGIPAPRVFNHGAKSVVFNWSNEVDNLYLTISADHISALISSPERIKRRMEYSANQLANPHLTLTEISAAFTKKPVKRLIPATVSDAIGRVD